MHSLKKPMTLLLAVLVITIAATLIDYQTIPTHNTNLTHFDAIIVLGAPANLDGTPHPSSANAPSKASASTKPALLPASSSPAAPLTTSSSKPTSWPSSRSCKASLPQPSSSPAPLILEYFPLVWRTHPAPWPSEYTVWQRAAHYCVEAQYCLKLHLFGFPASRFIAAQGQG
jgi:hypothetical protein